MTDRAGAPKFLFNPDDYDEAVEPDDEVLAEMKRLFVLEEDGEDDHLEDAFYDDDVLALPPPSFVVDGWVPFGSFTVFWGKPGVYKTFLLNEMQRSVRRGAEWLTHPTRQGMTVMYQGEGLEQLKPRIRAWDERWPLRKSQTMKPGAYFDRQPNIATPYGCATVARTVRAFERRHRQRVRLLIFDPLVEFMPANDQIEDMDPASRGLRALAQYLGCAVVAGHHSNAGGERARGTDHLYMRCGAYVQMEELPDGRIGVFQHKIKSSEKTGMVVRPEPYAESVVLEFVSEDTAQAYIADRVGERKKKTADGKAAAEETQERVRQLLLAAIAAQPGIGKDDLLRACKGQGDGTGQTSLDARLAELVASKQVRIEQGARKAQKHYLADA
jgi:hypothetical protein